MIYMTSIQRAIAVHICKTDEIYEHGTKKIVYKAIDSGKKIAIIW